MQRVITKCPTKLIYSNSPIREIYGKQGITIDYLSKFKRNESKLIIYRNLIRLVKFNNEGKYYSNLMKLYFKFRFLQDYNIRRKKLLSCFNEEQQQQQSLNDISNDELNTRLINTLNFIHNAFLNTNDKRNNEGLILNSILQNESSKINSSHLKRFKMTTLRDFEDQRLKQMQDRFFNKGDNDNDSDSNSNQSIFENDVWFEYIDEYTKKLPRKKEFLYGSHASLIHFDRNLILLNESMKLLL
ncbi:hypothetical protein CANARDRAFT_5841 [[Candida] arabinofermentans NRRL YB-2248]|uniref:Uncharacterized protein n=1 Tax=[Candida] arabinofermentans NRRL YB-2248 TaxID=983967 RepID=A0A1E4T6A7_9ASCO|nr:hypothetical protein CANARDRAFT_5841 [[Candida] arabinofermentans NRRL YB-2248]